jgi:fumarylacetoacetase
MALKPDTAGLSQTAGRSWVVSANDPQSDFPLANLPYGVFRHAGRTRIGVAIGDRILDLRACADHGALCGVAGESIEACGTPSLNALMALGAPAWSNLRFRIASLLDEQAANETKNRVEPLLIPMNEAEMQLPAVIGDYTDFYASIHHATRVGRRFRPDNPLMPNYKYVPIGYHGRASSIVVTGTEIRRPHGQIKTPDADPVFGPTRALDYELEIGIFIGQGNQLSRSIPIAEAGQHIFGLCLMNDWSARDMQSWEYLPLGPFLAKNFATTISPWVVSLDALAPYRVPAAPRPASDPAPLPYLSSPSTEHAAVDVTLEVYLESNQMREAGAAPMLLSRGNLRELYWTIDQLVTHHASNGCNLRPGDLLATGTISGAEAGSEGCLLEKQSEALRLPNGETRRFLEDGDTVTFRAYAAKQGLPRIGFGTCKGTVIANNGEQ